MKKDFGLTEEEFSVLSKLNSPARIQNFINKLRINFELHGDTCRSPHVVLKTGEAHCIEGAMLAALALRIHGHKPLVVDMTANSKDDDHVIAVFKQNKHWGAISKSNHGVLRYREPIYKTIRELILSYFHEYTNDKGEKTLRSFSQPVNLAIFDKRGWITREDDLWFISKHLVRVPHEQIIPKNHLKNLRKADDIEIKIGKITEFKK